MKKTRKSKAFIITFIFVIILLIIGYYLFANRSTIFNGGGVTVSKVFEPLLGTPGTKKDGWMDGVASGIVNITAEAGENLLAGDSVYNSGTNSNGNPIVMKYLSDLTDSGIIPIGKSLENINLGNLGKINIDSNLGNPTINITVEAGENILAGDWVYNSGDD